MSNGVMSEVMSAEALVPSKKLSARGWMRANLFNRWYNALLTLILALVIAYLGFRSIRYLFWTAEPYQTHPTPVSYTHLTLPTKA